MLQQSEWDIGWEAGWDACYAGIRYSKNPFRQDHADRKDGWYHGWQDAHEEMVSGK